MRLLPFLVQLDEDRIVAAIRAAEQITSGEIRIFIANHKAPDPIAAATEQFHRMDMTATRQRNGVLLFIAPRSQTFAIVADDAAHQNCNGEVLWPRIVQEMQSRFADSPTAAIVHCIARIAQALREHFPREADDVNELPDAIERR